MLVAPSEATSLSLRMLRDMLRVRRVDARMLSLQRQGRIAFFGPSTGQEAVAVGATHAFAPTDWVFPALREQGVLLVRGYSLRAYLAQLFGTAADTALGRQMPGHPFARMHHVVSWSSCIGTQLTHAVGAALGAARAGKQEAVIAFLGEGATSTPDFHAALNFAGVYRAPLLFICQNNRYALSVPSERQSAAESFAIKSFAYGVYGEQCNGNDPMEVYQATLLALERARAGHGATLLEATTFRLGPHSSSDDPSRYVSAEELAAQRRADPIEQLKARLLADGALTEEGFELWCKEIDLELDEAIAGVEEAPRPLVGTLFDDVYAEVPAHLREQREQLLATPRAAKQP